MKLGKRLAFKKASWLFIWVLFSSPGWSQHELAIDSSFAKHGWLEVSSTRLFKTGNSDFLVANWRGSLLSLTKFDLAGDTVRFFGVNGVLEVQMPDSLIIRRMEEVADGYLLMGSWGTDSLATVYLDKNLQIFGSKLDQGWWFGSKPNISTTHVTGANQFTLLAFRQEDTVTVKLYDSLGNVVNNFGGDGYINLRQGSLPSLHYSLDDVFYSLLYYNPNIGFPNAWGTRLQLYDLSGSLTSVNLFPEQFGQVYRDEFGRWIFGSSCDHFDQYKTSRLRYFDSDWEIKTYSSSSEAYAFNWPDGSTESISSIDFLGPMSDGGFLAAGYWFSTSPYDMSIFLKAFESSGRLDRSFGSWGNLFFKKPDEPEAAYSIHDVLQYTPDQVVLTVEISFLNQRPDERFAVKLNTTQIVSSKDIRELPLEIYPNPSSKGQEVRFSSRAMVDRVIVVDIYGHRYDFEQLEDFSNWSRNAEAGVYILEVHQDLHSQTVKLVKQ